MKKICLVVSLVLAGTVNANELTIQNREVLRQYTCQVIYTHTVRPLYEDVKHWGIVKVETQIRENAKQGLYPLEQATSQAMPKLKKVILSMDGTLYSPDIVYSIWSTSCQNNGFSELVNLYEGKL